MGTAASHDVFRSSRVEVASRAADCASGMFQVSYKKNKITFTNSVLSDIAEQYCERFNEV